MIEKTLSFLIPKLEALLRKELVELPKQISDGISSLKRELNSIIALLEDAETIGVYSYQYTVFIDEVQELVDEIEDILDAHSFHLLAQGWWTQILAPRSICSRLEDIDAKTKSLHQKRERYKDLSVPSTSSSMDHLSYTCIAHRICPLFLDDDADIVGIEEPTNKITSWIHGRSSRYKVVFVVGMSGSGKTTLARQVYVRVNGGFDCYAWIITSRSPTKCQVLSAILAKLKNPIDEPTPQTFNNLNVVDLMESIKRCLHGKSYIIVIDGLQVKDIWDFIEPALPKNTGGAVIVTSQRTEISSNSSDVLIHHMQPLSDEKARELFYKKAFPKTNKCPEGLMERSKSILQRCEGLPAGITAIGQSLSNSENTGAEWKKMYDSIGSPRIDGQLPATVRLLSMSYKDVPNKLKYCLLYLSIFPESFPVDCRKLVRLWIAEGLITPEEGQTNEVEQVGEGYIKELINWNLVKVCEKDFDGRPRSCRLHNFMHKTILAQSRKNTSNRSRRRRFTIQDLNTLPDKFTCARTVIVLGGAWFHPTMGELNLFAEKINFVKVLELDGVSLDKFPSEISGLLLLRYLSLRGTKIEIIPNTIGNLQFLETLDLKHTLVTTIPREALAKLTNLRHLFIYSYRIENGYVDFDAVKGFVASSNIINLNKLTKLAFVKASHELVRNLRSLKGLRKLGIIDLQTNQGCDLCVSIMSMPNLRSLNISSLHGEESLDLCSMDHPPPLLRRLYLKGRLEGLPPWISQLHDLARVRLKWSKLKPEFNPVEILGCLPNLLELQLLDAYEGQLLYFRAGWFEKLQILDLEQLRNLRNIKMEIGTLPELSQLIIKKCSSLAEVPDTIHKLTQLKKVTIWDMPPTFVSTLERDGKHHNLVRKIDDIQFLSSTDYSEEEDINYSSSSHGREVVFRIKDS